MSLLLALAAPAAAAPAVALVGATVLPVSGPPITDGAVLLDGEAIAWVGPASQLDLPADATVIALPGRTIVPGLVDLHSHVGGGGLHEHLGPVQAGISAIDAIDPGHVSLDRARAGGITTVNVMPGSGKLVGGQTAYLSLRRARTVDDMLWCQPAEERPEEDPTPARWSRVCGGMKLANGTNPQGSGGDPATRMGSAFLQRQALLSGIARRDGVGEGASQPDLAGDALVSLVEGRRTVHFHSHRVDDIVTAVRLKEETGIDLVVHHGSEAFKVAGLLAEAGVPVAVNVLDTPGGKEETVERRLDNPARLAAAGVELALITDDPVQDSRLFLRSGGLAVRGGLSEPAALAAMTLTPARLLGLDDRIGSLDAGKQADLVVLSGPPFSTWTVVEQTWVAGQPVYDRAADAAFATGGDAAPERLP